MKSSATTPAAYIASLPAERQPAMKKLRQVIKKNLPRGFEEAMSYGMLGWVVPHKLYPAGYHCDPKQPLPFLCLASQKGHIALYHMGLYAGLLLEWFEKEWPRHTRARLDMGKSCVRFKKLDDIPYDLIGELAAKLTPAQWVERYEQMIHRGR